MTQMLESEIRERRRLNEAWEASGWWNDEDEKDESDDDGPGAHNATGIRRPSPTPSHCEISARFRPLLRAIKRAKPHTMGEARWTEVVALLDRNESLSLMTDYMSHEEYIRATKRENQPIDFNIDRNGEIMMVWFELPMQCLDEAPVLHTNDTKRGSKSDEYRTSLKIMFGIRNITTDIVKSILHFSKHPNYRIPALFVAERLGYHQLGNLVITIPFLHKNGLLIDWDGEEFIWIMEEIDANKSHILRNTFKRHLVGQNTRCRPKETIEKSFWNDDPNIFLMFHTSDFARIVEIARKSTDCVKMTAGNQVLWTE